MNETNTNNWFMSFASEQLFGLLVASSVLALLAIIIVSVCRRQSAAARFIIWQMVSAGVVISAFVLLAIPGIPLRWEVAQPNNVQANLPIATTTIASTPPEVSSIKLAQERHGSEVTFAPMKSTPTENQFNEVASSETAAPEKLSVSAGNWIPIAIFVVWSTVSIVLLLRFLSAIVACYRVVRKSHPCKSQTVINSFDQAHQRINSQIVDSTCLAVSNSTSVPFVIGVANPKIVLPVDALQWATSKLEMVLSHELAHIQRRDILWHWVGQIACCVAWFNPLVWVSARRALAERERACDDRVINSGIPATDYGSSLVEIAAATCGKRIELAGCVSMVGPPLKKRIRWILSNTERRGRSTLMFASLIAGLFVALSVGASIIRPLATASYAEQPQISIAFSLDQDESKSENMVRLYGKVLAKDGLAISDATVRLKIVYRDPLYVPENTDSDLVDYWETKTDADGDYSFQIANFDAYDSKARFDVFSISAQGYAESIGCPPISKVDIPSEDTFSDARLLPSRSVTGQLLGPNGDPVTGTATMAAVKKDPRASWFQRSVAVEQDGSFAFAIPAEYQAEIVFYSKGLSPKRVSVAREQTKLGKVALTKGTVVKGNALRRDGSPVANAAVGLESVDGGDLESFHLGIRLATLTDNNGSFEMQPAEGEFELFVGQSIECHSYDGSKRIHGTVPPLMVGKKLNLQGEAIKQVSLKQGNTANISGVILWTDDRPVDGVEVTIHGEALDKLKTKTDSKGRYSIEVPVPLSNTSVFVLGKKDSEGVFHIANGLYADRSWGQFVILDDIAGDIANVNFEIREHRVAEMQSVTRRKFGELEQEKWAAQEAYSKAVSNVNDFAKRENLKRELHPVNVMANKYLKLEEEHRGERDVFLAIKAILDAGSNNFDPKAPSAIAEQTMMDRIFDHYLGHEQLYRIFAPLYLDQAVARKDRLYDKAFHRSPHRHVQAAALEGKIEHASLMLRRKQQLSQYPQLVATLLPRTTGLIKITPKLLDQQRRKIEEFENLDADKLKQDANRWIDLLIGKYGDVEAPYKSRSFEYEQVGELLRTRINDVAVGKLVPEIIAKDIDGNDFRLSSLKGKTVVLTFAFSSTQIGSDLSRAQIKEKYGDQGVEIVSVVSFLDSQKEDFLKEVESEKPYATFVVDAMYDGPIRKSWGGGLVGTFVIDRNGVLVQSQSGVVSAIDAPIQKALKAGDQ